MRVFPEKQCLRVALLHHTKDTTGNQTHSTQAPTHPQTSNPANGLHAFSVDSPRCFTSWSSFNTLVVLFCYPTEVDPQKPDPNRFLEASEPTSKQTNQASTHTLQVSFLCVNAARLRPRPGGPRGNRSDHHLRQARDQLQASVGWPNSEP